MKIFNIDWIKSIRSFTYAINGIRLVFTCENNFRIHLLITAIVVYCGSYFGISTQEWLWLLLFIASVLVAETFNSAIEKLVDMHTLQKNSKAGQVKDLAAGAVLIAAFISSIGGVIIFFKYFMSLIN